MRVQREMQLLDAALGGPEIAGGRSEWIEPRKRRNLMSREGKRVAAAPPPEQMEDRQKEPAQSNFCFSYFGRQQCDT